MRRELRDRRGLPWLAITLSLVIHVPLAVLYVRMLHKQEPLGWDDEPIFVEYRPFEEPIEEEAVVEEDGLSHFDLVCEGRIRRGNLVALSRFFGGEYDGLASTQLDGVLQLPHPDLGPREVHEHRDRPPDLHRGAPHRLDGLPVLCARPVGHVDAGHAHAAVSHGQDRVRRCSGRT